MITLGELADRLGLAFSGDAARELCSIAPLGAAQGDQVAFISNKKYLSQLADTRAGAVILKPEWQDDCRLTACCLNTPTSVLPAQPRCLTIGPCLPVACIPRRRLLMIRSWERASA